MGRTLLACACLLAPVRAAAEDVVDDEAVELDARIAALDAYLADLQRPTRAYWYTWLSVLGALGVGQAIRAPFEHDKADKVARILGSSLSFSGVLIVSLIPHPGRYAKRCFRALPARTLAEKRAKVEAGERFLDGEATSVHRATSWIHHAVAATLGVGFTLGLGLGFENNWRDAVISGVGAVVVIEARVWSRPRRALTYQARYRKDPTAPPELALLPFAPHSSAGVTLLGTF